MATYHIATAAVNNLLGGEMLMKIEPYTGYYSDAAYIIFKQS